MNVADITAWLRDAPHVGDRGVTFMAGLVELLRAQGLPLWRSSLSLITKHPELVWHSVQWNEDSGVTVTPRTRDTLRSEFFTRSPVALLVQGAAPIRVRLDRERSVYPICADLAAKGGTDYFAQGLPTTIGERGYISWATRAPGGFADDAIAALTELAPVLAQRLELESAYHATRALLEIYLGRNAGARVMRGGFHRGEGELIDAAIWFCDLRGFTAMSDRSAPRDVVTALDGYFDRVAGAVMERGGEVLKFVGDAVLAIYPTEDDPRGACRRALQAAEDALVAIEPPLAIGVALHVGPVMYGNIGSRERLDFTVISAAVNETCRLEGLCKKLGTSLNMSEAFVRVAQLDDAVDLGEQRLAGVDAPVRVFTR
jgi:adenylate cyclase